MVINNEHFGALLRQQREDRQIPLCEIAKATKLSQSTLQALEEAEFESLPPEVFVRGFVKSYARSLGVSDVEPLARLDELLQERRRKQEQATGLPLTAAGELVPLDALAKDEDIIAPKRGLGLSIFVVIVLVIATITVSYLLRQPPAPGEGLSRKSSEEPASLA